MPLYEYQCKKCKHRFEKIQKFSDKMLKKCPECGGPIEQMISAPAVHYKGSGWYVTDYPKKGAAPAHRPPTPMAARRTPKIRRKRKRRRIPRRTTSPSPTLRTKSTRKTDILPP